MNTIAARHNGSLPQTGERDTEGHLPIPAIHCRLRYRLDVVSAGAGWLVQITQSILDPPRSISFNR